MWTKLMSFTTNCSVPTQVSHPVFRQPRMHCTGTFNVRTIKQPYGGGPSRSILFRVQMAMGGKFLHQTMPPTQQQFLYLFRNGCVSLLPLNKCWSLSPASAQLGVPLSAVVVESQTCTAVQPVLVQTAANLPRKEAWLAMPPCPWTMISMNKKINCEAFSVFCVSRHVLHDLVFKWRAWCCLS